MYMKNADFSSCYMFAAFRILQKTKETLSYDKIVAFLNTAASCDQTLWHLQDGKMYHCQKEEFVAIAVAVDVATDDARFVCLVNFHGDPHDPARII